MSKIHFISILLALVSLDWNIYASGSNMQQNTIINSYIDNNFGSIISSINSSIDNTMVCKAYLDVTILKDISNMDSVTTIIPHAYYP